MSRQGTYRSFSHLVLLVLAVAAIGCRQEGPYPSRQIEFVIPFPPGGPADTAARIIQPRISELLGVEVVLVNRPGEGGALGAAAIAEAPADGYHVLATSSSVLSILPWTRDNLPFEPGNFVSVGSYVSDVGVIAVRGDGPWKNLEQLVEYAQKNPGQLAYGSGGGGTVSSFVMELLRRSQGLEMNHVPFAGSAPARDALLGGRVDVAAFGFASTGPLIAAGALQPLVSTSTDRMSTYPDVPTLYEKGLEGAALNIWMGLFVSAATSEEAKDRLAGALAETMQDRTVAAAVDKARLSVDFRNPDATRRQLESESTMVQLAMERQEAANE
jgi:tripartite-type tricarboxylate transporter receptor subunit TctC